MTSTTCNVHGASLVQVTLLGRVTWTVCGPEKACWCIRMPSATTGRNENARNSADDEAYRVLTQF